MSESLGREVSIVTDTHIKLPHKVFLKLENKTDSQKHRTPVKHYFITVFLPQAPLCSFPPSHPELEVNPLIRQKSVLRDIDNNF